MAPSWSYKFSEMLETHAVSTYGEFISGKWFRVVGSAGLSAECNVQAIGLKPSLRSSPVTPPRFSSLGQLETRFADEKVVTQ